MTLARRSPPLDRRLAGQGALLPAPLAVQRWRWARRVVLSAGWTLLCGVVQAGALVLPGRAKRVVARWYWAGICRVLGIERRVLGTVAPGRPILFAANHTSWLDVPVLGGTLEACFVAKAEVARWPVIRTVARLGRTVFVSRRAAETGRERDAMRARLAAGDDLILFPEGTSSDGTRVLPFRSPFFAVAEAAGAVRSVQPVSIVFDRLDYLPARRSTRPVTSWYGEMTLGGHFWRLARYRHLRATVVLHRPLDPADTKSRKAMSQALWDVVSAGNAELRHGRDPEGFAPAVFLDNAGPVAPTTART